MANYDYLYFDEAAWQRILDKADGKGPTRRGERRPRAEVERLLLSRRVGKALRQDRAWQERKAADKARRQARKLEAGPRQKVGDVLLQAMQPGEFYAVADLVRLTGRGKNSVEPVLAQRLWPANLVRRFANEAYRPDANPFAGDNPKYLWAITDAGVARRGGRQ